MPAGCVVIGPPQDCAWPRLPPRSKARPSLPLMTAAERTEKSKATARAKFEQAQQALRQRDLGAALKLVDEADQANPNQAATINLRSEI